MAKIIEMTQLSPTMTEGTIVKWIKSVGDEIKITDVLCEVETDKAVMELESFEKGVILEIIATPGMKVAIGSPILIIGNKNEDISGIISEIKNKQSSMNQTIQEKIQEPIKEPETKKENIQKIENTQNIRPSNSRIKISPLAKKLAEEKGIHYTEIQGTGPGGRIVKEDVLNYSPLSRSTNFTIKKEIQIPISGIRKTIATRLTSSKNTIPHYYLNSEIEVDQLLKIKDELNAEFSKKKNLVTPVKISVNDLIVKACSKALIDVPEINSSWRGETILQHGRVDIGIAVSIEGGLITPYIRNADQKSILEISSQTKELSQKAKDRKLKPEEYTDGTFTISNLGMFGISFFTAVINEPEAAILAVGTVIPKLRMIDGIPKETKTISLTLSCDHRVIDGAIGAKFLGFLKDYLEHPLTFLI